MILAVLTLGIPANAAVAASAPAMIAIATCFTFAEKS
jgi:hypothetical protein